MMRNSVYRASCGLLSRINILQTIRKQQLILRLNKVGNVDFRRGFLSAAYACQETWEKRLEDPIMNKIDLDKYYYELDRKFCSSKEVSAVDIDIFANKLTDSDNLDDVEELIHRFRRTRNTIYTLESTSHAVIRGFLQYGTGEGLMRILNDRVNYGVFPDYFTYNLIMDTYLKQQNYRDAAKAATMMMLQEDFEHPLSNSLALYSCHMYVQHPQPQPWDPDAPTAPVEDDTEEVWVRVAYITQPYFDDHFDLTDPQKLIGKTLIQLGKLQNDSVGRSYELLGWVMFENWNRAKTCLERSLAADEPSLFKNCLDKVRECLSKIADDEANTRQKLEEEFENLINRLKEDGKIREDDPQQLLEENVKTAVLKSESKDIEHINQKYAQWIVNRNTEIEKQVAAYLKAERMQKIEERMAELKKKEELVFFFENLEKHRLNIPPEEEDEMINEEGKVSGKALLDVPPEIEGKDGRYSLGIIEQHEPWWRWKEYKAEKEKEAREAAIKNKKFKIEERQIK